MELYVRCWVKNSPAVRDPWDLVAMIDGVIYESNDTFETEEDAKWYSETVGYDIIENTWVIVYGDNGIKAESIDGFL